MKKHVITISVFAMIGLIYSFTAPANHSEAEDVYDFALRVEQGCFSDQAGVNRVLALPMFGVGYTGAQWMGYSGRSFPLMIFMNRLLAVASLFFFYRILGGLASVSSFPSQEAPASPYSSPKASGLQPSASVPTLGTLLLAFSYGFWRYANEAETYMLASVFLLGAWCLAIGNVQSEKDRPLSSVLCPLISAVGILVHLLNLIPLLLIIPLYYLLSKEWKKALAHGGITGLLVLIGYAVCFRFLDWNELGAQHHSAEAGLGFANLLRSGIAFGQCLVSGNFLFGFEGFRELVSGLFPSRMLDEEFYMASHMPGWIKWAGCLSLGSLGVWLLKGIGTLWSKGVDEQPPKDYGLKSKAFPISCIVWLALYFGAIIRTEAGSPELWIMALVPFWIIVTPLLNKRGFIFLISVLFIHNLIAGLLPVMSKDSDYHAAKGAWLVKNSSAENLILTDYEPVMIFYLDYFSDAKVLSSGALERSEFDHILGSKHGTAYALGSFFQPMESMQVRSPNMYARMLETGTSLRPRFRKIADNQFGGIYILKETGNINE